MRYVDIILDEITNHPKISAGVAMTTTQVSGAVEYVEKFAGINISPDSWTSIGVILGIVTPLVIIYANLRRTYLEALQTKADLRIKELEAQKLQNEINEQEAAKKKRREAGEPLRRESD